MKKGRKMHPYPRFGEDSGIWTCDLLHVKQALWPTELYLQIYRCILPHVLIFVKFFCEEDSGISGISKTKYKIYDVTVDV